MKFLASAPSIVALSCLLLAAGCDTLGLPDLTRKDEVPPEVKAAPLLVRSAPPATEDQPWPRLGDVPFKPKDFSPKPVYDHYMDELEFQRAEAEAAKKDAAAEDAAAAEGALVPPALPKKE